MIYRFRLFSRDDLYSPAGPDSVWRRKLPEIRKAVGRFMADLKRVNDQFQKQTGPTRSRRARASPLSNLQLSSMIPLF
jgi:hypothetical protein